jgi:hypothetical protein
MQNAPLSFSEGTNILMYTLGELCEEGRGLSFIGFDFEEIRVFLQRLYTLQCIPCVNTPYSFSWNGLLYENQLSVSDQPFRKELINIINRLL